MNQDKNNQMKIVIDDGARKVPIVNLEGEELGVFYFRPTDMAIIDRYNEAIVKLDTVLAPLKDVGINAEGEAMDPEDEAAVKALHEAEERLNEICDYIFGGNMSEAFFAKMHPFSPVGGYFFCERALEMVGSFIADQFQKETQKVSSRVVQYTKKYSGGNKKRKKGRKK